MPADPLYPTELGPEPRPEGQFRADLLRYLDSLPTSELGSLLGDLPRTRPGVLMIELINWNDLFVPGGGPARQQGDAHRR